MRKLITYILMLFATCILVSCDTESMLDSGKMDIVRNIIFTVKAETHSQTKTSWGDYDSSEAAAFENKIIPEQTRVVVYSSDNTRLGELDHLYFYPINEDHSAYQFKGELPESVIEGSSYKIMVLANCPEGEDEAGLTYNISMMDINDGAIPMWGMTSITPSSLDSGVIDIGEIWLLRAAAKIKVELSESLKSAGAEILSATLNYYNMTGHCLPSGWETVEYTKKLDRESCFNFYRHAAVNLPLYKDDNEDFYLYVPEYNNTDDYYSGERAKISLRISYKDEEQDFSDAISFCDYSSGIPVADSEYNIVRNHSYEFTITKIAAERISLEFTVAPWDNEIWSEDKEYEEHDLSYPTYHNPVVPASYLTYTGNIDDFTGFTNPTMQYTDNEDGAFICYFQITAPTGVHWKPTIMGSAVDYNIKVYKYSSGVVGALVYDTANDNLDNDLTECATNEWYQIKIYPKNSSGEGVGFGIAYYQVWTQQYINLFINGEYENIKWPGSGDNPKIIYVEQTGS